MKTAIKKFLLIFMISLASAYAHADPLSDAKLVYARQDYAHAMQMYKALAEKGNPEAQVLLGEMYWFGDGMPIDLDKAEFWFKKAAAANNNKAQLALAVMRGRVERKADIEYYTLRFDGAEVLTAKATCIRPVIPAVSKTNAEIAAVNDGTKAWFDCYKIFVAKLNSSLPAGKSIPADIANLMSDDDVARALALMDKTYAALDSEMQTAAKQIGAENTAWKLATESFVAQKNSEIKDKNAQTAIEVDQYLRLEEAERDRAYKSRSPAAGSVTKK